jgi:hypothetical protein
MKQHIWVKSTRSGSNGECTEVRHRGDMVDVRDSKDPDGPVLSFAPAEWEAFIEGARLGEFDLS